MRIAIIGTGNVGATLGRSLARKGHEIIFGARDPEDSDVRDLVRETGASASKPGEAARAAEVIILAVPGHAAVKAATDLGEFDGRILIDCTNPIGPGLTLTVGHDSSGAEQVAEAAPSARVVKAFNTTGAENMADPVYGGHRLVMFYCGDDADAKATTARLIEDVGFEARDAGSLRRAALLEAYAMLWITQATDQKRGRNFGFVIVER